MSCPAFGRLCKLHRVACRFTLLLSSWLRSRQSLCLCLLFATEPGCAACRWSSGVVVWFLLSRLACRPSSNTGTSPIGPGFRFRFEPQLTEWCKGQTLLAVLVHGVRFLLWLALLPFWLALRESQSVWRPDMESHCAAGLICCPTCALWGGSLAAQFRI